MNNLTIINVESLGDIQKILLPSDQEQEYIIGANGYSSIHFDPLMKTSDSNLTLVNCLYPKPTGWFAQMLFTLALNYSDIKYLTYIAGRAPRDELERQRCALRANPIAIAAGRKATFIPEIIKTAQYVANDTREPTLSTPWTMDFERFMLMSKQQLMFNEIANGINKTFQDEVRFEYLFFSIFSLLQNQIKEPVLLIV